ncbi:hypothetical protein OEZ60_18130 [Defluviimonas sp. WL0024]|uniref:Uncharacterized protein n=2 Tax=Albidovulum TaxID=205889 RepID=A0ABT3J654_9RHOB|nr:MULTISPECIES: hypothetical protein [Defluviimonas]MCU9849921.1 hypothetical protein [Defluviimonas sp. WL0024]MCW3783164.1 hypothetical protein [Defluviimonas salinarum]
MTRLMIAIALVLAAAGTASAVTDPSELSGPARMEAQRLVPNGNFDNLTSAQADAIRSILSSEEDARGGQIRSVLN